MPQKNGHLTFYCLAVNAWDWISKLMHQGFSTYSRELFLMENKHFDLGTSDFEGTWPHLAC